MKFLSIFIILLIFTLGEASRSQSKLKNRRNVFTAIARGEFKEQNEHNKFATRDVHEIEALKADMDNDFIESQLNAQSESEDEFESQDSKDKKKAMSDEDKKALNNKNKVAEKVDMRKINYARELTYVDPIFSDWFSINSMSYLNLIRYPEAEDSLIHVDKNFTRINDLYFKNDQNSDNIPGDDQFYFRLNLKYIYYYASAKYHNHLGSIYLENILDVQDFPNSKEQCFKIKMKDEIEYKLCSKDDVKLKKKWMCKLQTIKTIPLSIACGGKGSGEAGNNKPAFKIQNIIHPQFLIPLPAPNCNEKWNYMKAGTDWVCKCAEGESQSPIDLPPTNKAIKTIISPLFEFEEVSAKAESDSHDGLVKQGQYHNLYYRENALRLYADQFGKIVTLDGAGYYCNEIVFHTPSEHVISGQPMDMEMKVICTAKTEGDFGKMLTLSFFFKKKPGAYNKFLDKLDYLNLPNPESKYQEIKEGIFIPNVFTDEAIEGNGEMIPFSFYSYNGSVSSPPCNENVIVMVASEPLFASHTTLDLFREALTISDQVDRRGRIIEAPKDLSNIRGPQALHGRPVFWYDKSADCPVYNNKFGGNKKHEEGHYEKRKNVMKSYIHVDSDKPSGLPNAFVVTDNEAEGFLNRFPDLH